MLCRNSPRPDWRRGIAATEFAIVAPVLAMVFCFCIDFTRIFYYAASVEVCATNGVMWASDVFHQSYSQYASVTDAARADFPAGQRTSLTVSSSTSGAYTTVTCSYSFVPAVNLPVPGMSSPFVITRTARARTIPVNQ